MHQISQGKMDAMKKLANKAGVISALAIDQRGSLQKMIAAKNPQKTEDRFLCQFKELVSEELTPYASAILLDPEFGLSAATKRDENAGLLIAYEKTGYDAAQLGRLPDLLPLWSANGLKEQGADALKFLLYYDVDEDMAINLQKHVFMERVGDECMAQDLPFFLELISYDAGDADVASLAYAQKKPHKVNEMMREFSKPRYHVDVLKMEVPVNMNYVEGFAKGEVAYSKQDALAYFAEQSKATHLPFIFLSAGVSAGLFQETLLFAKEAGSQFNGVLCGRATWKDGVTPFAQEGEAACREWLQTVGRKNMADLDAVLAKTATSLFEKIQVK